MPLPTSVRIGMPNRHTQSGITLEVYPSTVAGLKVELQQATANSTASSLWTSVLLGPTSAGVLRHTAKIPDSTRTLYFRARNPGQAGYSAGPFTPVVFAKPKVQQDMQPRILPQITYQGNVEIPSGSDVFLSSAKTVKVGTQPTTGTITKYLLLPFSAFIPPTNAVSYTMITGFVQPGTINTATSFYCSVSLPNGAKPTSFAIRVFRENTTDVAKGNFYQTQGDIFATKSTATQASTGWATVGGSTFVSFSISTALSYLIGISLNAKAAVANARLAYARIKYVMPSYDRAI